MYLLLHKPLYIDNSNQPRLNHDRPVRILIPLASRRLRGPGASIRVSPVDLDSTANQHDHLQQSTNQRSSCREKNEDGKSLKNPQHGIVSKAYEEFPDPLTKGRRGGFDIHIYHFQVRRHLVTMRDDQIDPFLTCLCRIIQTRQLTPGLSGRESDGSVSSAFLLFRHNCSKSVGV